MPHTYNCDDHEGKLCTRFTELNDCKPHLMQKVLNRRKGIESRYESPAMFFGTIRHEMMAKETEKTGKLPEEMRQRMANMAHIEIDAFEQELKAEIFEGIILHSTVDAVSTKEKLLIDYKTGTFKEGGKGYAKKYHSTMQLPVYAYMLDLHGIEIDKMAYIVELWDKEREKFYGYDISFAQVLMHSEEKTRDWLKQRCEVLKAGIELLKQ